MQSVFEQIERARNRAVSLIGLETPDQLGAVRQLAQASKVPVIVSDVVNGLWPVNQADLILAQFGVDGKEGAAGYQGAAGCVLALSMLLECKEIAGCYVCILNAQYAVKESAVSQALCLLRDGLRNRKPSAVSVVLLAPSLELPEELRQDVLVFDEVYPNRAQLQQLVQKRVAEVGQAFPALLKVAPPEAQEKLAGALTGLAMFPADQAVGLAMPTTQEMAEGKGFDVESIVRRKKKFIEQAKGVSLETPVVGFSGLAGLKNGKGFLRRLMNGPDAPVAVMFVDEIDKAMEGSTGGDLSGVSSGFLGALLSFTTEWETVGLLLYGVPGTGKTALARALCGEYSLPFLNCDLGAMRGGLVGESEANLRAAFKVGKAVSEKRRLLIVATCNRVGALAPELEARFNLGSFFFDYPSEAAKSAAWDIWREEFKLSTQDIPACDRWVGREIRQACELAYRFRCSITEVVQYIVPACTRDKEKLEKLRQQSSGRFIDIDKPGPFLCAATTQAPQSPGGEVSIDLGPQTSVVNPANPNIFVFTPGGSGPGPQEPFTPKERIGF